MPITYRHADPATLLGVASQVGGYRSGQDAFQRSQQSAQLGLAQQSLDQRAHLDAQNRDDRLAQQGIQNDLSSQRLGFDQQRASLVDDRQRDLAGITDDRQRDLAGMRESERFRRMGQQYEMRGQLQEAQQAYDAARRSEEFERRGTLQEDRQSFQGEQNDLNRGNQWDLQEDRQSHQLQRDDDDRAFRGELETKREQARQVHATAKDAATKTKAEVDYYDSNHRLAQQDMAQHLRRRPGRKSTPEQRADWEQQMARLIQVEAQAGQDLADARRRAMQGPAQGPTMSPTQTPAAAQAPTAMPTSRPTTRPDDELSAAMADLDAAERRRQEAVRAWEQTSAARPDSGQWQAMQAAVLAKHEAETRVEMLKRRGGRGGANTPPTATAPSIAPAAGAGGPQISQQDVEFTAQKYGMTPEQVMQFLGLGG